VPVRAARRLQRRRPISVDHVHHKPTERTRSSGLGLGRWVVSGRLREVDGQIESLAAAGTHQPRTVGRAGGKLGRTDARDEGRLCVVCDRRVWPHPVTDGA